MKNIVKPIIITLCLLLGGQITIAARKREVATAKEFKKLELSAGDTVVMTQGEWRDQNISFVGHGSAEAPVVVMAAEAGKTILTGASKMAFSGEWIVVEGLWFKDVVLEGGSIISFRTSDGATASNSTLRNTAVTGSGLAQSDTDYKWVSLYGTGNTVTHCSLLDKFNQACELVVWFEKETVPNHIIEYNIFTRPRSILDADGKGRNGQECIRIGTSDFSMQRGDCIVRGNYFYRCNGETEIISNKSCFNTYEGNLFEECDGTLTLRHGDDCTVCGNAFFGAGQPTTGGIRIIGNRHRVYNNYLQDLGGKGFFSAISLIQGEPNSLINGYFAAKECVVAHNTMVNCQSGLNVNHTGKRNQLPIENNTIACNVVVNYTDNTKAENIKVSQTPSAPVNTIYRDNIFWNGKIKGIDADAADITEVDPALRRIGGMYVPVRKTYLDRNRTEGFDFITTDFFGQPRKAQTTCGAFETVGKITIELPSAKTCGVTWKTEL